MNSMASCINCGSVVPAPAIAPDAQAIITSLQSQVLMLSEKATTAADRIADFEDEIRHLRSLVPPEIGGPATTPVLDSRTFEGRAVSPLPPTNQRPHRPNYIPIPDRLSSFLTTRKSNSNLQAPPTPLTPSNPDLLAALSREQSLRQAAEGKLDEASGELEELSAQLFTQANEMVAVERKARAQLEERVEVLERRDLEKRARLERLESAMKRIDRVRGLLTPGK